MNLPLSALLYKITDSCDYELVNTDISICYDGVQLYDFYDQYDDGKSYLFYVSEDVLKARPYQLQCTQLLHKSPFLCFCNGSFEDLLPLCEKLSIVFIIPKSESTFSQIFNKILNTFRNFQYWSQATHLSLLHGTSLQPILNHTSQILSHPMVVLDANFTVIGFVRKDNEPDPYMDHLIHSGYATLDTIKSFKSQGIFPQTFKDVPLQISRYQHPDGKKYYSMCYQLVSDRQTCGYVLVFCCKTHPTNGYQYLMDMVVDTLSLYFRQERFTANKISEKYELFLTSLLDNPDVPKTQLETQISFIPGLKLNGFFRLIQVTFSKDSNASYSFISWNLRNAFRDFMPFVYSGTLYILISSNTVSEVMNRVLPEEYLTMFGECFTGNEFSCSVSHPFYSLTDLPMAIKQCGICEKYATASASASARNQTFYYYEDCAINYMLSMLHDNKEMKMFSSPYYEVLKKYDEEHNTDLCDVFTAYLKSGRSINQTATALFMHRNTILNKVKKVTSLIGNEMEDYSQRLFFILTQINDEDNRL